MDPTREEVKRKDGFLGEQTSLIAPSHEGMARLSRPGWLG